MRKRPLSMVLLIILLIQCVKCIWMNGQSLVKVPASSIFYETQDAENIILQGQVYQKIIKEKYQILYLKNNSITYQNQVYQESYVIVFEDTFQNLKIGQTIKMKGNLGAFEEARNPGNFDEQFYYAKQKIYGSIWCSELIEIGGEEHHLQERLFRLRQAWKERLLEEMGKEKGALLCAMLFNEKGDVPEDTKELYQKNGYGHILAISGLHISFIGLGCYRLLRKTGLGYGVTGLISIGILLLYVLLLGFSVSIFRAFLMLLLRIGADITGRVYDMLTAVLLSATILVCYEPLYLVDAAFQLSHGAILAILFVAPAIKGLIGNDGKWTESMSVSLAIHISLLPIELWWYYEISTYGMVWNLLVIPLMSLLLSLGMMGSFLPFRGIWLSGCEGILILFEWIGKLGNHVPGNRIVLGKPTVIAVIAFYLWLTIIVVASKYLSKYKKVVLVSFVMIGLLFCKIPDGNLTLTMLDVGQGDCIYVSGPDGSDYLVDGGSSDVNRVGKYRIESFLKWKGVGSLEYVFVSHGDLDHYSGIEEMIERQTYGVKIKNLILPSNFRQDENLIEIARKALEQGIKVSVFEAGKSIAEGELQILCLQPCQEDDLTGNAGSMVLEFQYRDFEMLFTGDVEAEGEELLMKKITKSYDVLKVAHHGSKNSTTEAFLRKVKPQVSLISAGENNSYGHPHEETLVRLKEANSRILSTLEAGVITIKTNGNSLTF